MKSSWKKALVLLLVLAMVVSGSLLFVLGRKQRCSHPFPMWLEVTDESILDCPEHIQLNYAGCSVDPSSTEEEQVTLQIECTLTERTGVWQGGFSILYRDVEDSRWHIVFSQGYADDLTTLDDSPGTDTLSCLVPRRLFYHRGSYKIVIPDRGSCDLPREKLWDGPDDECGQLSDIHTESGFPMYMDTPLAGPAEDYSDEGLVASEVIKGNEADTLKLTLDVPEERSDRDAGWCQLYFCPLQENKLRLIYWPEECAIYDFYQTKNRSSLAPGLNTVEYTVPKGLFQHDGDYYITCSVGRYKLFGD